MLVSAPTSKSGSSSSPVKPTVRLAVKLLANTSDKIEIHRDLREYTFYESVKNINK